jgi:hypothetical protein
VTVYCLTERSTITVNPTALRRSLWRTIYVTIVAPTNPVLTICEPRNFCDSYCGTSCSEDEVARSASPNKRGRLLKRTTQSAVGAIGTQHPWRSVPLQSVSRDFHPIAVKSVRLDGVCRRGFRSHDSWGIIRPRSGFSCRLHGLDLLISDPFLGDFLGAESRDHLQMTAGRLGFHLESLASIRVWDNPINCHTAYMT